MRLSAVLKREWSWLGRIVPLATPPAGGGPSGYGLLYGDAGGALSVRLPDGSDVPLGGGGGGGTAASSVVAETSYGQASAVGVATTYARGDHTHGTPAIPTAADVGADPSGTAAGLWAAHEGAADPHVGYALESSLGAAAWLGVGSGGVQAWDADLDAVAGLSSTGLVARTGSGSAAARTITAGSAQVTVTNGSGVSGNPTINLAYAENVRGAGVTYPVGLISEGQFVSLVGGTLVGVTLSLGLHVDMEREITQCIAPEIALSDLGVDAP